MQVKGQKNHHNFRPLLRYIRSFCTWGEVVMVCQILEIITTETHNFEVMVEQSDFAKTDIQSKLTTRYKLFYSEKINKSEIV